MNYYSSMFLYMFTSEYYHNHRVG